MRQQVPAKSDERYNCLKHFSNCIAYAHCLSLSCVCVCQQVLAKSDGRYKFDHPNPFASPEDEEELASCAYRWGRVIKLRRQ